MKLCIGTATFEIFVTSGHLLTENLLSWFFRPINHPSNRDSHFESCDHSFRLFNTIAEYLTTDESTQKCM